VTAENVMQVSDMTMKVAASGTADTETHWIGVRG
jgi:hypothetical protein